MAEAFGDDTFREWTEEDQFRRREEVNAHIAGHVRTRPAEHWFGVFDEVGIWYAPVNTTRTSRRTRRSSTTRR